MEKFKCKIKHNTTFYEREYYKPGDLDQLQKWLDSKLYKLNKGLKEDDIVFFMKDTFYPKRKFNTFYPNVKIGKSDKANVIICNPNILKNCTRGYNSEYFLVDNIENIIENTSHNYVNGKRVITNPNNYKIIELSNTRYTYLDAIVKIYNENKDCKFMDCISLVSSGNEELDSIIYEKINTYLESKQTELIKLAVNMLTAYDYEKYKSYIALLFNTNPHIFQYGSSFNIECKTLLKKLEGDFPSIRYSGSNLKFCYKLYENDPDNILFKDKFEKLLKTQVDCKKSIVVNLQNDE
jgi:hypothetical protein